MPEQIRAKLAALREEFAQRAKASAAERRRNYWRAILHRDTYHSTTGA